MNINKLSIGNKIRELRKENKISQEKLAELVDTSTRTISNIERGIVEPKLQTVFDIATVFDGSIDDFVGLVGERNNYQTPESNSEEVKDGGDV